jgi:hypothetical protein
MNLKGGGLAMTKEVNVPGVESLSRVHDLNEIAAKANFASYQIRRFLIRDQKRTVESDRPFIRGISNGLEVCKFLSESLTAALATPVDFSQLSLLARLKPVRSELTRAPEGLRGLKDQAEKTRAILDAMEKQKNVPKARAQEAERFFNKISELFLKSATSQLLRAVDD